MTDVLSAPSGLEFLVDGGEMGERVRERAWSTTPLGPVANWSPALRATLATVLASPFPLVLAWGRELIVLHNDAYRPLLGGKPEALGRPFLEVWSEARDAVAPLLERALAGEACRFADAPFTLLRHGKPEQAFFDFAFSPVRDENGVVVGVLNTVVETTARVLAERRQAFLLALGEKVRDVADPADVIALASEALARQLDVAQVAYAEVEPGGETVVIEREWNNGAMTGNRRRHRLDDYGPKLIAALRRGETIAIPDVRLDPRTSSPSALAAYARAGISGLLDVPVIKANRMVAILGVHSQTPRPWSLDDVTLAQEIAERTWEAAERAGAAAEIREREARYRTLFAGIDAGFCIVEIKFDRDGRAVDHFLVEVNPAFERLTGAVGAAGRWASEAAPDIEQRWHDAYARVVSTGKAVRFEDSLGSLGRWCDVHAFPTGAPGQNRVAVLLNDISERRAAEQTLRELNDTLEQRVAEALAERQLLADLVETTDAFVQVVGMDFRWLAINHAAADEFERIFGARPKVGDSMLDLLADKPEHRAAVEAVWSRALAGEQFTEVSEFGDFERDRRYYEMKYNVLRNAGGERVGAYQFVYDVTHRIEEQRRLAEAEEALRQSQKMEAMGQLTGGVAHDFNNLLTPIIGALDMLMRRGLGSERERRLIDGALQSADRAKTLVQRLLAFARRQPLQPVAVDLRALVENMAGLIGSTLGPKIDVQVDIEPDLPAVTADPNQLEMALLNLAVNARDAMPEGGALAIRATRQSAQQGRRVRPRPGPYVRLSVADSGTGMDEATRARAVEPFFSTKGIGKGTGLGLSMVHGLMAQLGGSLTIESRLGRGTTIQLWLPVSASPAETGDASAAAPAAPRSRGTALLVDDENLVRMSTADMLTDLGFEVIEAGSAEGALKLVEQGAKPDILITDHLMPGMSGAELAERLRASWPALPVLVVSGYAEAGALSADLPRLTKPFRNNELAAALDEMARGLEN